MARLLPARRERSEDLRRREPRPRPTTAPAQRRALGRWRARRGTAVAHSARCARLLLEERCARFRVGVAEAAHEPAHCATVGCEGIRDGSAARGQKCRCGWRRLRCCSCTAIGPRARFMSVCVLPRSVERHCLSSAAPPRDSRADRREASSLTNITCWETDGSKA